MRDGVTGVFRLCPRNEAVVSVFDSNFLVGDGIWVRSVRLQLPHNSQAHDKFRRVFEHITAVCNLLRLISIAFSNRPKQCTWILD